MRIASISVFLLIFYFAPDACAQPGCPDPQATNFNPAAVQNDGSCLYPVTNYTPILQATIDGDLKEISGLHRADGEWWSHNDSGHDPVFYSLNPENGNILKNIELKDAHNRDWEDVCSDGANLYLGDFGNNNNDRQNLGVYRVPFTAIGNSGNQTVNADEYTFLPFSYPDQTDFDPISEDSTVFDCEAMFFAQNKLHFFTKNRKEYRTTHYSFNLSSLVVQKVETFDVQGLITGASISPDENLIALVGYDLRSLPTVFTWLLWDWQVGSDLFFSGNKRRIEFGSALSVGQVESIGFESNHSGYIANEITEYAGILFVPQTTRSFDFSPWVPESVPTKSLDFAQNRLHLYPNPCSGTLFLETEGFPVESVVVLEVINPVGSVVARYRELPGKLELGHLPGGLYRVRAIWGNGWQWLESVLVL